MEYANVGTSGYCTQAQLDTLYAAGWDMYGHARIDMTTASEATQRAWREARNNRPPLPRTAHAASPPCRDRNGV